MKLLIATDCFLPRWDGIARFLDELLPQIHEEFDITIIAPDFPGEFTPRYNAHIIRVPLQKISFGDYTPAKIRTKLISDAVEQADIVWTQTTATIATSAINAAKKFKKPYIAYIHSIDWLLIERAVGKNPLRNFFKWLALRHVKNLLKDSNLLMVPSHEVLEIMRWYGINAPIRIVPLGINPQMFIPTDSKIEAKNKIGLDPNSPIIGYVGRISHEKDLPTLFKAFDELKGEFSNTTLLIVGDGLKSIKHKYAKKHNVHFVGAKSNVVPYLQAMDMYVLPSLLETTSLSTLEAMSCEVPIIATKVGMVKEYVKEKENGLLFPQKNHYVLTLKMKWILENPKAAKLIGKKGRETVLAHHNWDLTCKRITDILNTYKKGKIYEE
jgi:glycosyltransferase involved in cell wall biosynthesis